MNIELLKEKVSSIERMAALGFSENDLMKEIVEYLYNESNGRLIDFFIMIDDLKKKELQERRQILYNGLEDAMHGMSHYASVIEEGGDINAINSFLFNPKDGNIAFLIRIAMAYFPNGTYDGCSQSGVYFFNKFRDLLKNNSNKYLNGDSTEWAKSLGYYEYIKLVLDKYPNK